MDEGGKLIILASRTIISYKVNNGIRKFLAYYLYMLDKYIIYLYTYT